VEREEVEGYIEEVHGEESKGELEEDIEGVGEYGKGRKERKIKTKNVTRKRL
jgi:hypothetical protein